MDMEYKRYKNEIEKIIFNIKWIITKWTIKIDPIHEILVKPE